jgi:hypothetical protein
MTTLYVVLYPELAISQHILLHRFHNGRFFNHLQNVLAQYSFGSVMYYFKGGKKTKNCERQNNCTGMYTKLGE